MQTHSALRIPHSALCIGGYYEFTKQIDNAKSDTCASIYGVYALYQECDCLCACKRRRVCDNSSYRYAMDPLADKFMVFAALLVITVKSSGPLQQVMIWASVIVFLRELGVTSLRLVCANSEVGVVAASWFGKCKTVAQIAAILVLILEPLVIAKLFKLVEIFHCASAICDFF